MNPTKVYTKNTECSEEGTDVLSHCEDKKTSQIDFSLSELEERNRRIQMSTRYFGAHEHGKHEDESPADRDSDPFVVFSFRENVLSIDTFSSELKTKQNEENDAIELTTRNPVQNSSAMKARINSFSMANFDLNRSTTFLDF